MKKLLIISIITMFALSGLLGMEGVEQSSELVFNEASLKYVAETKGYGYKTGNLNELKKLVEAFNEKPVAEAFNGKKKQLTVRVPNFVGIPSNTIVAALKDAGFDVLEEWKKVLAILSDVDQKAVFESKSFPDNFWAAQKGFVNDLRNAFKALEEKNKENPFGLDISKQTELEKLFEQAKADKLMVRSTGKEDTRTLANAGGNESIANVEPTMAAVLLASEKVVVSYFGKKSLKQRLGLKDQTLFEESVFCPILIQRMIGEQKDMVVPRCGVMFTEEGEGGIGCFTLKTRF